MEKLIGKFLWSTPPIFYAGWYSTKSSDVFDKLQSEFIESEFILLMSIPWSHENRFEGTNYITDNVNKWLNERRSLFPKHKYIYMCNTPIEVYQFRKAGIEAHLFNQNIFLDPLIYKVSKTGKLFTSIYNAQFSEFKRHNLLLKTRNCGLLGHSLEQTYFSNQILPYLGINFELINQFEFTGNQYKIKALNWHDMVGALNSARVGLCLSKEEGAMFAAVEYLLCGLPVVTTLNAGGRDSLLDGRFVYYAPDDPFVINEAIEAMANLDLDPDFIRSETIRKQKYELKVFCDFLNSLIYTKNKMIIDFNVFFQSSIFYNKLRDEKSLNDHIVDFELLKKMLS